MNENFEYLLEKLYWAARKIWSRLTGSSDYELQVVKERIPHVPPFRAPGPALPSDEACNKY